THPHVLPLHDSGEAAGFLYYLMPFVDGQTLRARLNREHHLPLEEAVQIAREVADALSYAHGRDVVHRDIKPENILLSGGHAVVADFGIARAISVAGRDKFTATGMAVGTPAYMSPEQASGQSRIDGRADIYALGCMLYEMLAGDPPFLASTPQAVLARQALDPVPRLRTVRQTVPRSVEQAITKALAKVAADRFATAARGPVGRVGRVPELRLRHPHHAAVRRDGNGGADQRCQDRRAHSRHLRAARPYCHRTDGHPQCQTLEPRLGAHRQTADRPAPGVRVLREGPTAVHAVRNDEPRAGGRILPAGDRDRPGLRSRLLRLGEYLRVPLHRSYPEGGSEPRDHPPGTGSRVGP